MTRVLDKTPRIEYHQKGIFFNYNIKYDRYYNKHTDSVNEYEGYDFICIRLEPVLFARNDFYYDAHTYKGFTLLGISINKGYSYQWKDLKVKS